MPKRKLPGQEKKEPASFSVEKSIKEDFELAAANNSSNMSRELREYMIKYIDEDKKRGQDEE